MPKCAECETWIDLGVFCNSCMVKPDKEHPLAKRVRDLEAEVARLSNPKALALFREHAVTIAVRSGTTVAIQCDDADDAEVLFEWLLSLCDRECLDLINSKEIK